MKTSTLKVIKHTERLCAEGAQSANGTEKKNCTMEQTPMADPENLHHKLTSINRFDRVLKKCDHLDFPTSTPHTKNLQIIKSGLSKSPYSGAHAKFTNYVREKNTGTTDNHQLRHSLPNKTQKCYVNRRRVA